MPQASKTEHRVIHNTALPYYSNASITSTTPHLIKGSQNIMTGLRGWIENRPGFSQVFDTTMFQNVQRNFIWRRWTGSFPNGGAFIWMVCDIDGGVAKVYKKIIGTDSAPVLIWTSTSSEPFDFVVSSNTCFFGNGTDMMKFDSSRLTTWGGVGPVAEPSVSLITGTTNVYTSWCYCYTYWDAIDQHETSPSPISSCSGVFTNKTVQLGVVASTNPRFTNIRVYRTPDGGAQDPALMLEITGSPFPNATATISDSTADVDLSIRSAPEFFRNNPPTPCKGFVTYGGRIWGFNNNTTYYSGFEEIANGVPEESWPGGLTGNFYPWANEVFAHASLIDGIAILLATSIQKIEGDSLDTFRRYTLLEKRGTRSRTSVTSLGGSVAWLDTSNTIWISDIGEIGMPIRPDTAGFNPANVWIAMHISGIFHWVTVLDGSGGVLYVYDLDKSQWMPPWTVGQASALFSGETSLGVINLLMARGRTKVLQMAPGTYTDDSSTYSSVAQTNLYPLTPDDNPSFQGTHDWSEIKTDTVPPTQVLHLTDDDPTLAPYTDLTPDAEPSPLITQGKFLQSWRYPAAPESAAFMSMKFVWNTGTNFHLYQMDEAMHPAGG